MRNASFTKPAVPNDPGVMIPDEGKIEKPGKPGQSSNNKQRKIKTIGWSCSCIRWPPEFRTFRSVGPMLDDGWSEGGVLSWYCGSLTAENNGLTKGWAMDS
jgi:hypothetical protein